MTPRFPRILACAALAVLVTQAPSRGQIEVLSKTARQKAVAALDDEIKSAESTPMAAHLKRAKGQGEDTRVLASRVAADFGKTDAAFVHYAVPPMSNVQRLPDIYPIDGQAGEPVRIIAAKDEYEPGAFLVYSFQNLGKVSFTLTPFKAKDGKTFPAANLDLKVIKVWYQNRNAWYSYFGDTGFKLVPELLLNDEDLIRVDTEKKANYARLTEKDGAVHEKWLNPPRQMNDRYYDHWATTHCFMPMRENFHDSKTLQPVLLEEGSFRNFFLTVHVTKDIPAGLYEGAVKLADKSGKQLGSIPVELRVLPFELPAPKSYINPEREFLVSSYDTISLDVLRELNGDDLALAKKQLVAVLRNQAEHNETIHWMRNDKENISFAIDAMKEAGQRTDILLGGFPKTGSRLYMEAEAKRYAKWFDKKVGHHNVFLGYGDEPGAGWLMQSRPVFEAYQKAGFKFIIAGGDSVFYKAGYLYDWHNVAKDPTDSSSTHLWNQLDNAYIAWYACMHVGPENPAYNRMQYGMAPYLAGYNAACNYEHTLSNYNDDTVTYRPMVFCYGVYDGVLDTLQWEGFREGVDDIRYATLLCTLARKAAKSKDIETHYAGLKALQHLATFDYKNGGDLDANRLEMTRFILQLRDLLAAR